MSESDFVVSKALRTLGVVEFVWFLLTWVDCSCNGRDLATFTIPAVIGILFRTGLGTAALVLLYRDSRVCEDGLMDRAFWFAVGACIAWFAFALIVFFVSKRRLETAPLIAENNWISAYYQDVQGCAQRALQNQNVRKLYSVVAILALCAQFALTMFVFVTSLKLAIPNEYSTS